MTAPVPQAVQPSGDQRQPISQRRQAFTTYLYGLHSGLTSNPKRASESRQALARLRRIFSGARQQAEAYEYVFAHDPPEAEQDIWLLLAGLFALNPQSRPRSSTRRGRSLGAAMGELEAACGPSATRRFTQLLAREQDALPHHLRQTVRLLATHGIAIDYGQLLEDLVVLLGEPGTDTAHRIRLKWAREFHRPHSASSSLDTTDDRDDDGRDTLGDLL